MRMLVASSWTRRWMALVLMGLLCGMLWAGVALHAEPVCRTRVVNASGVASAAIAVTNAAAVVVAPARSPGSGGVGRCDGLIYNEPGGGEIRCAPSGTTHTTGVAGVGQLIPAGQGLSLGAFADASWSCIATTATAATVSVTESTP